MHDERRAADREPRMHDKPHPRALFARVNLAAIVAMAALSPVRAQVHIAEGAYEGRPQFVVSTPAATWYYDQAGGGFSRLIDREGRDWIGFKKEPLRDNPASAAAGFRGLPNLAYGATNPDAGAGHPGFDRCESLILSTDAIRTRSKSGVWEWKWRFHDDRAVLTIDKADPVRPYWFLYEGAIAGRWSPTTHYWGTDRGGPRHDIHGSREQLFDRWRWAYFGDDDCQRVLLVAQVEHDDLDDTFWYMGATDARLNAPDGMVVFGFGRGPKTSPRLTGAPKRFVVGFVEGQVAGDQDHARVSGVAAAWIMADNGAP